MGQSESTADRSSLKGEGRDDKLDNYGSLCRLLCIPEEDHKQRLSPSSSHVKVNGVEGGVLVDEMETKRMMKDEDVLQLLSTSE